jgi:hypothetical protein
MIKRKAGAKGPKSNGRAEGQTAARRRPKTAKPRKNPSKELHEHKLEKFRGVLQEFNFSPKGGVEGFLLHADGQTVQVNVTADVGFAVVRGIGQHVEATVEKEAATARQRKGSHPVYRLVTLTGTDGKPLIFAGTGDAEVATVQGTVKRINYTRHGEANGVILDTGDFIYLKPAGMKRAGLKVGDQVAAEGPSGMMPLGQQVVDAKTVNGIALTSKKPARAVSEKAR